MFGVTGLHLNQIKVDFEKHQNGLKYYFDYYFWLILWVLGHFTGGAIIFGISGWLGSLVLPVGKSWLLLILGIISCLSALHQFKLFRLPMPQLNRQVSRLWLAHLGRHFTAFGYGLQLGLGVTTRIKIFTTYLIFGCAFLTASIWEGLIIGAVFGVARALLPVILAPISIYPDKSFAFALKFNSFENIVHKINGIILILSGIGLCFYKLFV